MNNNAAADDVTTSSGHTFTQEQFLYGTSEEIRKVQLEHFGLLGILKVIRMTEPDLNMLALGMDLTTLGLNLHSPDSRAIHSTFRSPWSSEPCAPEPEYFLPPIFYAHPNQLKSSHLTKFISSILFYMFYTMPKDVLQAHAAAELYKRGWKYVPDRKEWFTNTCKEDLQRTIQIVQESATPDSRANAIAETAKKRLLDGNLWIMWDVKAWTYRPYLEAVHESMFLPASEVALPAQSTTPTRQPTPQQQQQQLHKMQQMQHIQQQQAHQQAHQQAQQQQAQQQQAQQQQAHQQQAHQQHAQQQAQQQVQQQAHQQVQQQAHQQHFNDDYYSKH
eukprot:GHVL01042058.1.p1 GENE.GHVL01042058.1~~GHVL01042058.1.p1  ORF type:complete len:332 (+),score=69.65 GHVL01042058.1:552-1547(+)